MCHIKLYTAWCHAIVQTAHYSETPTVQMSKKTEACGSLLRIYGIGSRSRARVGWVMPSGQWGCWTRTIGDLEYWAIIRIKHMARNWSTWKPMRRWKDHANPHRKALPRLGIESRIFLLWGDSATEPLVRPKNILIKLWTIRVTKSTSSHYVTKLQAPISRRHAT